MFISRYLNDLVLWAPAKVNLFLEILGKRPDGYHQIATLMVAIRLFDTLVFREPEAQARDAVDSLACASGPLTLRCYDRRLSAGPDNLVLRAAKLLQDRTGCKRGATIRLVKRIPMAAGLAGGSTDAAATLFGLNELWQTGLSDDELAKLGGELGSDIPFFFHTPAAWCTGRGEIVTPIEMATPLDLVLVCPAFGLATADVYKRVIVPTVSNAGEPICGALRKGDVDSIGHLMHNRLQQAAETMEPRVAEYLQMLADAAPAGRLMSGSGSTLFALCRSPDEAQRVAAALKTRAKARDFRVIVTRTL